MPTPRSRQPRKQRKAAFSAHQVARRRLLSVPLSKELRARYGRRQLPVRKGDTVRVLRGSYEGQEERVAKVNTRSRSVTLDNITVKKADAKLKPLPVAPNHLVLTRLNLSDSWRRRILKVSESAGPEPGAAPAAAAPAADRPEPAKVRAAGAKAPAPPAGAP
jgi:large subunit ribosomal protein L24